MFKIFENRVYSIIFTLFILFFIQTVEGNAGFVQNQFQEVGTVAILEKNVVVEAVDKAVIHDVEGQDGFAFGKAEKVSAISDAAFWRKICVKAVFSSLSVGDFIGAFLAIFRLFF
ncbi:hypothetical protein [Bartonella krasnovii]|uniref:Uncharacterized protein n=1 Tax=Bartonella krasnovii TaxID=2267275 RepID=A0A5B9D282_9HYPH|nr:hypothetical protein [Bartonella krasnovii]QEE12588.1 hypothetical protein D1092_06310 [Bartonella krasnovii]UNF28692.1 hypothetical protein MNL13_05565 [Bartonella krasnovii]UNF35068.1 hypothetical protein MNL12_05570 [Bartonella krasnovii]UNF36698.1 hypothetical protein MNL11_06280 [Bartonella krasnovii]UNF38325.1 hypothetical protein MNL10_06130 [Bartonella krasnovii]